MRRRFEWDPSKNRKNLAKHGIQFEAAIPVFDDPNALLFMERFEDGDQRWVVIGWANMAVLFVVHTASEASGDVVIRIISARKATRKERRHYEEGKDG